MADSRLRNRQTLKGAAKPIRTDRVARLTGIAAHKNDAGKLPFHRPPVPYPHPNCLFRHPLGYLLCFSFTAA